MASDPSSRPLSEPHPVPRCPLPRPSSLRLQSNAGNARSVGAGHRAEAPASKPQGGAGHLVCPFEDSQSYFPPPSPARKLPLGLSGGNLQGWGVLRGCNSSCHHPPNPPRPRQGLTSSHGAWRHGPRPGLTGWEEAGRWQVPVPSVLTCSLPEPSVTSVLRGPPAQRWTEHTGPPTALTAWAP